jgi:hypothetical protein
VTANVEHAGSTVSVTVVVVVVTDGSGVVHVETVVSYGSPYSDEIVRTVVEHAGSIVIVVVEGPGHSSYGLHAGVSV